MRRKIFLAGLIGFILMFVILPDMAGEGAESGLMLWFKVILPSLLPFMIVSSMLIKLKVTDYISAILYPVFHRVFGISKGGCYPALLGMLSGYPLGAKMVWQAYMNGDIGFDEAQYILGFCNNASPMFMLEYIGVKCLGLDMPWIMPLIIYLSAYINALISRFVSKNKIFTRSDKNIKAANRKNYSVMEALDESILDSFVTITKVGGYIILFSILTEFMTKIGGLTQTGQLIGVGIMEITTGGEFIAVLDMPLYVKAVLLSLFCAFGGMSSVAQTSSVLLGSGLSTKKYIMVKARQSVIAAVLALVVFQGVWPLGF